MPVRSRRVWSYSVLVSRRIVTAPHVLVVAPSLGATSVKDLIALAKAKPGQLNFGSAGVGSGTHFDGEEFKLAAGIDVVHVPFKGPAEALLETATGRIHYVWTPLSTALPFIASGASSAAYTKRRATSSAVICGENPLPASIGVSTEPGRTHMV